MSSPAPHHDLSLPQVVTDDSRAAAEVLSAGDPTVVDPGASLLIRATRRLSRFSEGLRKPLARGRTGAQDRLQHWPWLAAVVARYRRIMGEAQRQQAALAAAGGAFWLIISVFPAMIAAVMVFGLVVDPAQVVTSLNGLTDTWSGGFGADVTTQLTKVASAGDRSLSVGLIVSVTLSLWSASAGLAALTRAIRQAFGLRPLTFVEVRRRSMVGAVFVVVMLGMAVTFAAVEASLIEWADRLWVGWVAVFLDLPVAIVFLAFMITALYRLAIGKRIKWRPLIPGVLFATVGLLAIGIGYSAFVDYFTSRYADVYGAVAGTILALLLAYVAVYFVVLGAIINAQYLADQRSRLLARSVDPVIPAQGAQLSGGCASPRSPQPSPDTVAP